MALPKMNSKEYVMGLPGVESYRISLKPNNTSGSYKESDQVIFGIPSYGIPSYYSSLRSRGPRHARASLSARSVGCLTAP